MSKPKNIAMIALCAALTGMLSQIALPLPSGIPLTLQSFAVALCAQILGPGKGTAATGVWLVCGGMGLPLFSGFRGGVGVLFGPTGGFLFGFLFLAVFCGMDRNTSVLRFILSATTGLLLCHTCGTVWFSVTAQISLTAAFLAGSLPYLVKDLACLFAAKVCAGLIRKKLPSIS